mmetsp:Transcript_11992/g.37966  ORF Transcript_11992/g.37966 Transcript_11992/m.37966 type:complete len:202 (-) Transcript_11992:379-984(-)
MHREAEHRQSARHARVPVGGFLCFAELEGLCGGVLAEFHASQVREPREDWWGEPARYVDIHGHGHADTGVERGLQPEDLQVCLLQGQLLSHMRVLPPHLEVLRQVAFIHPRLELEHREGPLLLPRGVGVHEHRLLHEVALLQWGIIPGRLWHPREEGVSNVGARVGGKGVSAGRGALGAFAEALIEALVVEALRRPRADAL